jgi:hypothetical protein
VKVGLAESLVTALARHEDLLQGMVSTVSLRGVHESVASTAGEAESSQFGAPIDDMSLVTRWSIVCFDQFPAAWTFETPREAGASPDRMDGRIAVATCVTSGPNGFALFDYVVGISFGPLMRDEGWRDHL